MYRYWLVLSMLFFMKASAMNASAKIGDRYTGEVKQVVYDEIDAGSMVLVLNNGKYIWGKVDAIQGRIHVPSLRSYTVRTTEHSGAVLVLAHLFLPKKSAAEKGSE